MSDPAPTPAFLISEACIAFSEALMACRASVVTTDSATSIGRDLYSHFNGIGALTEARAPLAKRSIEFGIATMRKNGAETVERIVDLIKSTYQYYAERM